MPPKAKGDKCYKETNKLQGILMDIHQISERKPKMAGTPHNDKKMPYFMEAQYPGEGIRSLKGIDQGTCAVKNAAKNQPEKTDGFKNCYQGVNSHHAQPTHHQID
jgi:hypothetical protein